METGDGGEDETAGAPIKDILEQGAAAGTLEAGESDEDQAAGAPITGAIELGEAGEVGCMCVLNLPVAEAVGGIERACVLEVPATASDVRCMPKSIDVEQLVGDQALQGHVARGSNMDSGPPPEENQALAARAGD